MIKRLRTAALAAALAVPLLLTACSSNHSATYKMDRAREAQLEATTCKLMRADPTSFKMEKYLDKELGLPGENNKHDGTDVTAYWIKIARDYCPDTINGTDEQTYWVAQDSKGPKYADASAVADQLTAGGLQCDASDASPYGPGVTSQVSCYPDGADEVLINTWDSATDKRQHAVDLENNDGVSGDELVAGGNWLIDCDAAADCKKAQKILGGVSP